MQRYSRDFDIISISLNSGLALVFRPISGDRMAIEVRQNDEAICSPAVYSYEDLRQWLTQLALDCGIVKMGLRLPGRTLAMELEDGFATAVTRTATGFYISTTERGQTVGYPTFITLARMIRIIDTIGKVTGPPDQASPTAGPDEPDDSGEPNLNLN